jgi:hypothetical protein
MSGDEALKLFGARAGPGMAAMLNIGSAKLSELNGFLRETNDLAGQVSKDMESGIGGALRELESALEGVQIAFGDAFGDDFKAALEDPEKQEALATANKEFAERIAQEKEYEGEYQKNLDETLTTLEAMQQEEGLPDEDIDSAMDFLVGIVRDGIMGKFTRESIEMAIKAIRHDSDVEAAGHEGEVKGRNSKIEEKLRKAGKNDGTADLAGKNGGGSGGSRQMPDLGAIGRYDGTQNIWERGGEKRKAINR